MNEPNGHAVIVMVEDNCSSARPACGPSRRRNDHGYETEGWHLPTQQEPENAGEVRVKVRIPVCDEEADWRYQACSAQIDGRLPIRDKVPGCSRKGPLDLRHSAIAVHHSGPLRGPFTVPRQPAEPNGVALDA